MKPTLCGKASPEASSRQEESEMAEGDDSTQAGPDRQPAEGGTGTAEVGIDEQLADEEQEKEQGGAAQGGKGRVD